MPILQTVSATYSASNLLIRQAQVLLPTGELLVGDVQIEGGKIVQVAPDLSNTLSSSTTRK